MAAGLAFQHLGGRRFHRLVWRGGAEWYLDDQPLQCGASPDEPSDVHLPGDRRELSASVASRFLDRFGRFVGLRADGDRYVRRCGGATTVGDRGDWRFACLHRSDFAADSGLLLLGACVGYFPLG